MVVPAGLVNNWHRELNEIFNLDFEVFGSEGDITDRKTNAFAKHDLLIASIDTLKRPHRIKRVLEAPRWDLVVFDEAHHLTAYRTGGKVRKTENYKLAEALKGHTRLNWSVMWRLLMRESDFDHFECVASAAV